MPDFPFNEASGFLSNSGGQTLPVQLLPGEVQILSAVGSWKPGTMVSVGGDVVLTNIRVIFSPLNVKDVTKILGWALAKAGAPGEMGKRVDWLAKQVGDVRYTSVDSAVAAHDASLFKPPTFIATLADGNTQEIGVLCERRAANIDKRNNGARDQFVAAINAR